MTYKQAIAAGAFGFALLVALAMVLAVAYAPPVPTSTPTIVFENIKPEPANRPPVSSKVAEEGKQQ